VLRLHGAGSSVCQIAAETTLDRKQVTRILAHEGIRNPPSTPATSKLPEILELRSKGVNITEIGRRLGFSRNAVRKALGKVGCETKQHNDVM
jgi:DNA-binding NarL/FixJ family response regulator